MVTCRGVLPGTWEARWSWCLELPCLGTRALVGCSRRLIRLPLRSAPRTLWFLPGPPSFGDEGAAHGALRALFGLSAAHLKQLSAVAVSARHTDHQVRAHRTVSVACLSQGSGFPNRTASRVNAGSMENGIVFSAWPCGARFQSEIRRPHPIPAAPMTAICNLHPEVPTAQRAPTPPRRRSLWFCSARGWAPHAGAGPARGGGSRTVDTQRPAKHAGSAVGGTGCCPAAATPCSERSCSTDRAGDAERCASSGHDREERHCGSCPDQGCSAPSSATAADEASRH